MSCGIYKITNIKNNKCYIGASKNVEYRRIQHFEKYSDLKLEKKLYFAMQDWGVKNFKFEILEICDVNFLIEKELFYIKKYNSFKNGYNASWGGEGLEYTKNIKILNKKNKYKNNKNFNWLYFWIFKKK